MKQCASLCLAVLSFIAAAQAQSESDFFRLNFTLKESEGGKPVNSRSYQMIVSIGNTVGSIRSGGRVPLKSGENGQYQYIDVGVNIDVKHANRTKDELSMQITADISGSVEPTDPQARPTMPPIIRQTRWDSNVVIPLQKPVTVFSSDDTTSKRQLQLEVTATPIH